MKGQAVSVPLWGLFNLTRKIGLKATPLEKTVSVPLWGLFNLTGSNFVLPLANVKGVVSVPLWGLFNLTLSLKPQVFTDRKIQKTAEIVKKSLKAL